MIWYYKILGEHVHVRVFTNHALSGYLCFRDSEFRQIKRTPSEQVTMLDEPGSQMNKSLWRKWKKSPKNIPWLN